jgi:hypothetical protein
MADKGSNDDELFSMEDLEKNLKKGRPPKRLRWFAGGLAIGIAATILIPMYAGPYLPAFVGGQKELLSGPVLAEERDGDRLLLTIRTEPGALIASFSERVAEIGLLVDPGDTVTIAVDDYDPFIADPDFEGVRKGAPPTDTHPATTGEPDGDPSVGETGEAADSTGTPVYSEGAAVEEGPPGETAARAGTSTRGDTSSVADPQRGG